VAIPKLPAAVHDDGGNPHGCADQTCELDVSKRRRLLHEWLTQQCRDQPDK
jgi:hypothetical protein